MGSRIRVHVDGPVRAAQAFGRAQVLAGTLDAEVPASLYAAPLVGDAFALGAHQHAPHALRDQAFARGDVLRRATGGATVFAGEGIGYAALCLRDASALVPCPAGKLLNRYVRGLLGGLRTLSVPAYYFGRDFVSANADPCAYLAWSQEQDGRFWLETFVAIRESFALPLELCAYPTPIEPRFRGKPLTTLEAVLGKPLQAQAVLEAIVQGYLRMGDAAREEHAFAPSELLHAEELGRACSVQPLTHRTEVLTWSEPHEEAIGFVSAGVALDAQGAVRAVELAGDLLQSKRALCELRAALVGASPDAATVGAALDRAYGAPGMLEGLRSLKTLQAALLEASERTRTVASTPSESP